jgi:hypothetical protein
MTSEILYTGLLGRGELAEFIKDCGFSPEMVTGETTYFLAEQLPTKIINPEDRQGLLVFEKFSHDRPFESYKDYTSGRIFSKLGELRWDGQQGELRVIYLGDPSFASVKNAVGFIHGSKFREKNVELKDLDQPRSRYYYLFGTKLEMRTIEQINGEQTKNPVRPGDFAELRIHRVLRYPAPGRVREKGYVQLQVQEYVDPGNGQVQFFRFQGLDEEHNTGKE